MEAICGCEGKVLTETETEGEEMDRLFVAVWEATSTAHADATVSIHPERRGKEGRQRKLGGERKGMRGERWMEERQERREWWAAARIRAQT